MFASLSLYSLRSLRISRLETNRATRLSTSAAISESLHSFSVSSANFFPAAQSASLSRFLERSTLRISCRRVSRAWIAARSRSFFPLMTKTIPPPTMMRTAAAIHPNMMTGSRSGLPGIGCAWWGASAPLRGSARGAGRAAVGAATRVAVAGGAAGRDAGAGRAGPAGAGRGGAGAAGRAAAAFAAWRFAAQAGQRMRSDDTAPEEGVKSFPHISHFGMDGSLSGRRVRTAGAALLAQSLLEHLAETRRPPDRAGASPAGPEHYGGGDAEGEEEDDGEGEGEPGLGAAEAGRPEVPGEDVGDLPALAVPGLVADRAVEDPLDLDHVATQLEPLRTVGEVERDPVRGVGLREKRPPDVLASGERPSQARRDELGVGDDPPHPHELAAEEVRSLQ